MLTFGSKYSYLVILSVGFALGFYICSLFNGCGRRTAPVPQITIEKPEKIQKQVAAVQAGYQSRIDSLDAAQKKLQSTLQTTQAALAQAKKKNLVLQTQIYDLLDRPASADTATMIADCDSLKGKVQDLVTNSNAKDSLYEDATTNLELQVRNKDSTIQVQQEEYQALKASLNQSLGQQQWLQLENTALQKTVRHQKFKGTLKTIGLAIAAVLATHYLTHP